MAELTVLVKGAGEVASGIAYRLHQNHFKVCLTEIAAPLAVTRGVTFSEAVFEGAKTIMGVTAVLIPPSTDEIHRVWEKRNIPLIVDPEATIMDRLNPDVLVDAIMAKHNTRTRITDAPLVIGIGPGFYAGRDVHVVIESNHSENLGKVIQSGEAEKDTGSPVPVAGLSRERVVWAPEAGTFTSNKNIGDSVTRGEVVGQVGDVALKAPLGGMLRGLIRSGVRVTRGTKLFEVDPVNSPSICGIITKKVWIIGGGVLEAIKMKYG